MQTYRGICFIGDTATIKNERDRRGLARLSNKQWGFCICNGDAKAKEYITDT